jgi:multidrug efflux pump subunit AcrA (membrane-fusion protein)
LSKNTKFPHLPEFFMSKPPVQAFFIGRALAEAVYEHLETTATNAFSELGKFDAEQRERLRQFTDRVMERANREADSAMQGRTGTATTTNIQDIQPADLQVTIDELRAEVALVRSELQRYRTSLP